MYFIISDISFLDTNISYLETYVFTKSPVILETRRRVSWERINAGVCQT